MKSSATLGKVGPDWGGVRTLSDANEARAMVKGLLKEMDRDKEAIRRRDEEVVLSFPYAPEWLTSSR